MEKCFRNKIIIIIMVGDGRCQWGVGGVSGWWWVSVGGGGCLWVVVGVSGWWWVSMGGGGCQ